MKIATGTYIGNGSSGNGFTQFVECGFPPDCVIVSSGRDNSIHWLKETWSQRGNSYAPILSIRRSVAQQDTGFIIGDATEVNSASRPYHWIALADDGDQSIETNGFMGNGLSPRVITLNTAKKPLWAFVKRDTARTGILKALTSTFGTCSDGTGATTAKYILSLDIGSITVDANPEVNEMFQDLGEASSVTAFFGGANSAVITWTGDGAAGRVIPTGLGAIKGAIVYREDGTIPARLKTDTMPGAQTMSLTNTGPRPSDLKISGGSLVIGGDSVLNASGAVYYALILGNDSGVTVRQTTKVPTCNVGTGRKVVYLPGRDVASRVEFGASDSLMINGAMSFEWMGQILYTDTTSAQPANVGAVMLRHGGTLGTVGNVDWGMVAVHATDGGQGMSGPMLNPMISNNYNNVVNPNPASQFWRSARLPPRSNRYTHLLITHDGGGGWKFYQDGKLVNQRAIDMVAVNSRPNIQSVAGHLTSMGARWNGSAWIEPMRLRFAEARVWTRALSAAEAKARYRRAALGLTDAADVTDYLEAWDAGDAFGTTIPAKVNTANNGLIVNGVIETR